jgi:hypothetical protein
MIETLGRGRRNVMGRKRHGAEQIIAKLREAEVELARGKTAGEICRKLGIIEQTYYVYGLPPAHKQVRSMRVGQLLTSIRRRRTSRALMANPRACASTDGRPRRPL